MHDLKNDPISNIEWKSSEELNSNLWNPNVVFTKEMKLLEFSLLRQGWIQPILVSRDGIIIDGFHRWTLSKTSKKIKEKYSGKVPCVVLDLSQPEAMLLTVRINRAKGSHIASRMHELVRIVVDDFKYTLKQVEEEIGAHKGEVELLYQESVFTKKDTANHKYSKAWEPRKK